MNVKPNAMFNELSVSGTKSLAAFDLCGKAGLSINRYEKDTWDHCYRAVLS